MKPLRWLAAAVVWILASVVGLLGVVLSVTLILLPLGLPLLWLSRRLYGVAGALVVPRAVRHPVATAQSKAADTGSQSRRQLRRAAADAKDAAKAVPTPRRKRGLRRLLPG
jgi:hypothetical protein